MDLVIDFTPDEQASLEACAKREGIAPDELALKALRLALELPPRSADATAEDG